MLNLFVTAKLKGKNEARQGAVITLDPLVIRGQTGTEYLCEGNPVIVENPPETCIGCDLPLGRLCGKCEETTNMLVNAMSSAGLSFESIEIN